QSGLLDALGDGRVERSRAEVFRGSGGVFIGVIVGALLRAHFDDRQRLAIEDGDGGFAAGDLLLEQHFAIIAQRLRQGWAPVRDAFYELHTHARALTYRLEHDWRLPTHGPAGLGGIDHQELRRRNPRFQTALFG